MLHLRYEISLNSALGPQSDEMTYLDFTIKKEYLTLKENDNVKDLLVYHNNFMRAINCTQLLSEFYTSDSDIGNIDHISLSKFVNEELKSDSHLPEKFVLFA